jgi:mono/diheme cytochrome c family protein
MPNPVPRTDDAINEGLEHFADHCAVCHDNDGSGNTEMGRGLWPKAPDMRLPATQQLTDGELFSIIEHGVRFTGMPGWGTGNAADERSTWQLVHFIRALPHLSAPQLARMRALNPRSPEEVKQELEEERFLNGQ